MVAVIESAIKVLRNESFHDEANQLEHFSKRMKSDNSKEALEAAKKIQGLCQIRSYGDLSIKSMNGWEWNTLLKKANKKAGQRIKKISESSTHKKNT